VGESETSVLGELNQPKNSKILWRNQEIVNGGLGVALMVVLERKRERSEGKRFRGKFCPRGFIPQKLNSPVSKTEQSGFSWTIA
jgi:hypothetical protein